MKLDRAFQMDILQRYASVYPQATYEKWHDLSDDEQKAAANLLYLQEHGLVEIRGQIGCSGDFIYQGGKITAKGMDFLADDGGLSAILGVVTIKLHDDTIKSLVEARILQSDLPEQEKKRFLDHLRELPAETTKHLVLKLVDIGLGKGPEAMSLITDFLSRTP